MSYVLETLKQRDRRIARERLMRRLGALAAYFALLGIGVAVATPVAYRRGYDAGKDFQAEQARPTCQAPEAKVTRAQIARDKSLKECAENLRRSVQPTTSP